MGWQDNNAKIGRWAYHRPRISWEVLNPKSDATCFSGQSKRECEEWLLDTLKRHPDSWVKDYHVGKWEFWDDYCGEREKAIILLESLKEKGYWCILQDDSGCGWNMQIGRYEEDVNNGKYPRCQSIKVIERTMSEAISKAILQLIDQEAEAGTI